MAEFILDEFFAPLLTTEVGKKASWITLGCAVLILLLALYSVIGNWYTDLTNSKSKLISEKTFIFSDNSTLFLKQIPQKHLFGSTQLSENDLPITSLQLRLMGVIKATPTALSKIIISEANQPGKVYGIGDVLTSGVTVYAIVDDGVILENGGKLEKLPLPRTPLNFQGMPKPLLEKP